MDIAIGTKVCQKATGAQGTISKVEGTLITVSISGKPDRKMAYFAFLEEFIFVGTTETKKSRKNVVPPTYAQPADEVSPKAAEQTESKPEEASAEVTPPEDVPADVEPETKAESKPAAKPKDAPLPAGEEGIGVKLRDKFVSIVNDLATQELDIVVNNKAHTDVIKYNGKNVFECRYANRRFTAMCHPESLTPDNKKRAARIVPKEWGWPLSAQFVFTELSQAALMKTIIVDGLYYRQKEEK